MGADWLLGGVVRANMPDQHVWRDGQGGEGLQRVARTRSDSTSRARAETVPADTGAGAKFSSRLGLREMSRCCRLRGPRL
jgi:hypothetical protein